jgi:hypothetical protein
MPYKDPQKAKEHGRIYYLENKDTKWKNSDGSWKKAYTGKEQQRRDRRRECYHEYYKERHAQLQKKYRAQKRVSGNCLICKKFCEVLHFDHCHKTNLKRGYICINCNLLLGHAFDNVHILKEAIIYLENFYGKKQ